MCMSQPKAPKAPPPPAEAPRMIDDGVMRARGDSKRRLRMMAGRNSTLLTGSSGLTNSASTSGNLLGGG